MHIKQKNLEGEETGWILREIVCLIYEGERGAGMTAARRSPRESPKRGRSLEGGGGPRALAQQCMRCSRPGRENELVMRYFGSSGCGFGSRHGGSLRVKSSRDWKYQTREYSCLTVDVEQ